MYIICRIAPDYTERFWNISLSDWVNRVEEAADFVSLTEAKIELKYAHRYTEHKAFIKLLQL